MTCLICAETFKGISRKKTKCEFCDFEACLSCCKTFILGEPTAKCMNTECNKEWSRKFLVETCGQTFVNRELKKHREELLYDKERSLLPATQPFVERIILLANLRKEVVEIDEERKRLGQRKQAIREQIYQLEDTQPDERVVFTRACPADCRGFLSTQLKCGLCNIWACGDCHEVKGETKDAPHICNPDTVATTKLLAADTKACPTCRTNIYKIDGCDQMWCTMCHTAFSWRTGKIETKIHNPHYYEYMRNQSEPGEIPRERDCQTLTHATARQIRYKASNRFYGELASDLTEIDKLLRNVIHLEMAELTGRYKQINDDVVNRNLRISYMRGIIDEERFKTLLQRSEKGTQKRREIRDVLLMVVTTITDVTLRLESKISDTSPLCNDIRIFFEEVKGIRDYANAQLADLAKTYKSAPIVLEYNMELSK